MIKSFSSKRDRLDGGGCSRFTSVIALAVVLVGFMGVSQAGIGTSALTHSIPSIWRYIVVDLGRNDVPPILQPIAINNSTTVALNGYDLGSGVAAGYLWTNGASVEIPNFGFYDFNNNGDYTGTSPSSQSILVKNGATIDLRQFGNGVAECLNDSGDVGSGGAYWKYSDHSVTPLVDPHTIPYTYAINNSDVALSSDGGQTKYYIGSSQIADSFIPGSINNAGQIVGNLGNHVKVRIGSYSPANDIDLGVGTVFQTGDTGQNASGVPFLFGGPKQISTPVGPDPFDFYVIGYIPNYSAKYAYPYAPGIWYEATPSTTNAAGTAIPGNFATAALNDLIGPNSPWTIEPVSDNGSGIIGVNASGARTHSVSGTRTDKLPSF